MYVQFSIQLFYNSFHSVIVYQIAVKIQQFNIGKTCLVAVFCVETPNIRLNARTTT